MSLAIAIGVVALVAGALWFWFEAERWKATGRALGAYRAAVRRAQHERIARGYDPDARVYPHPMEGRQVRMLVALPGLEVGDVGLIRLVHVSDDTELFIRFDGHKDTVVMLEQDAGVQFEVLP